MKAGLFESELEAVAAQCVGKLLFIFGRLETNLGLALGNAKPQAELEIVMARVTKMSFVEKLDAWQGEITRRYFDNDEALARWRKWFALAHELRSIRNRFAHGRWGFIPIQGRVAHVTGLPGDPAQCSTFYTIDELTHLAAEARRTADEFSHVYKAYPVYG